MHSLRASKHTRGSRLMGLASLPRQCGLPACAGAVPRPVGVWAAANTSDVCMSVTAPPLPPQASSAASPPPSPQPPPQPPPPSYRMIGASDTPVWACEGCPGVVPGHGPVCFGNEVPHHEWLSADTADRHASCSRFARGGRLLTLHCLVATRLLAAAPPVPSGFNLFYGGYRYYRLADIFKYGWRFAILL